MEHVIQNAFKKHSRKLNVEIGPVAQPGSAQDALHLIRHERLPLNRSFRQRFLRSEKGLKAGSREFESRRAHTYFYLLQIS